ncbi:MAG TPA: XRE family transcriptional regulator [bacterium]|nr:XRE family transcriptional regulator [bacterium]
MDNILAIINQNPKNLMLALSKRAKERRLFYGYKRTTLAKKAGVNVASLKRFELTGQISLVSLLKLAFALDCLAEFSNLFPLPEAHSIKELEQRMKPIRRKRGHL